MNIHITGEIIEGIFVRRINRFIAEIIVNNKMELAHVPNTGRMKEILIKGNRILVRKVKNVTRKTKFDLLMVYHNNKLIAIDSRFPNELLYKGFKEKKLNYFDKYNEVKKEVIYKNSRFDIGLFGKTNVLIEAKCVTFVDNNIAMFPDAPTERGIKHIEELIEAKYNGFEAGIFFIIQRSDANIFMPNWNIDKKFASTLKRAYEKGVVIKPLICIITKEKICIDREIELVL